MRAPPRPSRDGLDDVINAGLDNQSNQYPTDETIAETIKKMRDLIAPPRSGYGTTASDLGKALRGLMKGR